MNTLENNSKNNKTWRKMKLGEIVNIKMGQSPSSQFYNSRGEGLPFYQGITDFGSKYPNKSVYCTNTIKIAEKGEILFSVRAPVGEVNVAIEKSCIGRGIAGLFMKNKNNEFLYYLLKYHTQYFKSISGGTTYESIGKDQIAEIELLIPEDINEQRRIADILFAFDDKIEVNNKIIKTLEEMAQEIFKEWFVRFRFPGWQKVKFVNSELGKIPEGWKASILEEIMNLRREKFKSYNEWKNEKLLDLGRFPQKSLAINEHGKGEEIKTSAFKFYKGDILFGAVRPYFHKVVIAPFDGVTNKSVFVIFPKKQEFYSYLITILFSESTINYATNMASGTKMPVLKYEDLANMNIVLPDFKILSVFNEIVDKFYKILIEKVEENQKLVALRDLLLPKLMSGEIRV